MSRSIGNAEWTVQLTSRGGSPFILESPHSSISVTWPTNTSLSWSVTIPQTGLPNSACCDVFNNAVPWRDEVAIWRDNHLFCVGPLITVSIDQSGGELVGQGLFHWMEQRFLPDIHADGDAADVFRTIFNAAYEQDDSPNIELSTRASGIQTTQDFQKSQFHRAADALRDLSTYGLDFIEVGRRIVAGPLELFPDEDPLLILDNGVSNAKLTKEGQSLATDVAVLGSNQQAGNTPFEGRAVTNTELYGLIQRSYTQLLLESNVAADAAALARVQSMQPSPLRLSCDFTSGAAFDFEDIFPGRRGDCRLTEALGCGELVDTMRLQQVQVKVSGGVEQVSGEFVPTGEGED